MDPVNKVYTEASKQAQTFYHKQYQPPYLMAATTGILGVAALLRGSKLSFFVGMKKYRTFSFIFRK
jgi:hypothetical protein